MLDLEGVFYVASNVCIKTRLDAALVLDVIGDACKDVVDITLAPLVKMELRKTIERLGQLSNIGLKGKPLRSTKSKKAGLFR